MKTKECETVINLTNAAKAFHKTFILNWKSTQKIITNECIIRLSEDSKWKYFFIKSIVKGEEISATVWEAIKSLDRVVYQQNFWNKFLCFGRSDKEIAGQYIFPRIEKTRKDDVNLQ